jgi:tungstate transport system ATP-binding protein
MRLLSFLERPTEGEIIFKGETIGKGQQVSRDIRRQVSLVMQDHYLFAGTVSYNIAYGLRVRHLPKAAVGQAIGLSLAAVGLVGFEKRRAETLSGGESKRVAIARALALKPEVLLLDEPTANIDKRSSELIEQVVLRLKDDGRTVVMTTHDFSQAYRLGDTMLSLFAGKATDVSPENVFPCDVRDGIASLAPGREVHVQTELSGKAHVAIDPRDIIISLAELKSSARNSLRGRVKRISIEEELVRVHVDAGVEFVSIITPDSLKELALAPGTPVYLTFKAASVRIL